MLLLELDNNTLPTTRTGSTQSLLPSSSGDRPTPNPPLPSPPADDFPPQQAPANLKSLGDEELVALCQESLTENLKCYEEIVSRYRDYIYHYTLRRIGNPHDAEEITQDAFIRIYNKISQFEGRSTFKTWLFRIVGNLCSAKISSLATRRINGNHYDQELSVQFNAALTDPGTSDLDEKIHQALKSLDESKRTIIQLRFFSGLQIEEISEVLNLKMSATKMRLYRALEEVKEAYLRVSRQEPTS